MGSDLSPLQIYDYGVPVWLWGGGGSELLFVTFHDFLTYVYENMSY